MSKSQAAVKTDESREVAAQTKGPAQLPDFLKQQAQQDSGAGVSSAAEDNLVPLIKVMQSNSPQVDKSDPAYVEGAEPGDFLLRATNTVIKGSVGFVFQPCHFHKEVLEWIDRDKGGGFVGRHPTMPSDAVSYTKEGDKRERHKTPDGHELQETRNFAGYLLPGGPDSQPLPYVIPFSGTGHSVARGWMFIVGQKFVGGKQAPIYSGLYRLTTKRKQNAKGKWHAVAIEDYGFVQTTDDYNRGKALFEAFESGAVKSAVDTERTDEADGGEDDAAAEKVI